MTRLCRVVSTCLFLLVAAMAQCFHASAVRDTDETRSKICSWLVDKKKCIVQAVPAVADERRCSLFYQPLQSARDRVPADDEEQAEYLRPYRRGHGPGFCASVVAFWVENATVGDARNENQADLDALTALLQKEDLAYAALTGAAHVPLDQLIPQWQARMRQAQACCDLGSLFVLAKDAQLRFDVFVPPLDGTQIGGRAAYRCAKVNYDEGASAPIRVLLYNKMFLLITPPAGINNQFFKPEYELLDLFKANLDLGAHQTLVAPALAEHSLEQQAADLFRPVEATEPGIVSVTISLRTSNISTNNRQCIVAGSTMLQPFVEAGSGVFEKGEKEHNLHGQV